MDLMSKNNSKIRFGDLIYLVPNHVAVNIAAMLNPFGPGEPAEPIAVEPEAAETISVPEPPPEKKGKKT